MSSAKLSDYQLKKIIRAYASGLPAADLSRAMKVSYLTVRTIYGLIRRRMLEAGLYESQDSYEAFMEEMERDDGPYWDRRRYDAFLSEQLSKRRGVTQASRGEHIAELIFWFAKPNAWTHEQYAERHFLDIMEIIRLGGPLNRPLSPEGVHRCREYRLLRQYDLQLREIGRTLGLVVRDILKGPRYKQRPAYRKSKPRYGR